MQTLNVVWHEGMLLRPQHFQQHDRYYDEQLTRRTSGLHAHAWGFTRLDLDTQFLALGKIVLSDAACYRTAVCLTWRNAPSRLRSTSRPAP